MARKYHTLIIQDGTPGDVPAWGIAFGAYDKADVEAERDEYRDKGWKAKEVRIITTGDKQADIDATVARINAALDIAANKAADDRMRRNAQ